MDRGAWQAAVLRVTKRDTTAQLSTGSHKQQKPKDAAASFLHGPAHTEGGLVRSCLKTAFTTSCFASAKSHVPALPITRALSLAA